MLLISRRSILHPPAPVLMGERRYCGLGLVGAAARAKEEEDNSLEQVQNRIRSRNGFQ